MILKSLKKFNSTLFLAVFVTGLLPTIYTTVRFNFLGDLPSDWGYNIASQLQYVNLIFEVIQEALLLPLFFLLGKTLQDKRQTKNKIKTGLIATLGVVLFFSAILFIFAHQIVVLMAQNTKLVAETVSYIRFELIGIVLSNIVKFLMIIAISKEYKKNMYVVLALQMILTIAFDALFISELSISFYLGARGIAYTNIIVNLVMMVYLICVVFKKYGITVKNYFKDLSFAWLKEWIKVGGFSGLESFVRNFAFIIMIIRMVNVVGEQGTFWVANGFIWSWLLLPVLALGEVVKKETSEGSVSIKNKSKAYFIVTTLIVLIWVLTIPFWKGFFNHVMNIRDYEKVFRVVFIQLFFYIVFAYNNVMDSTFYGVGKTDYMLWQSLIVNIIFYGGAFILFKMGLFEPSLIKIALMFGIGMLFDFVPTILLYIKLLRDRNICFRN